MTISIPFSALFILSIALLPLSFSATEVTTVLDINGKKVQANTNYYILPVARGMGGGVAIAQRNNTRCPFYVAQASLEVSNGIPIKFLPTDTNDKFVQVSKDMNFVFFAKTMCMQSMAWRLGDVDEVTGKRYVTTNGVIGNPGGSTVSNWFKIEKADGDFYRLVFCPGVCNFCKVICGDVGIFVEEDGRRWLGLNNDVRKFRVMFKKM
ncbi:hypothetical protein ACHQM5_004972 [Ranunculus cassubicifolius]